MADPASDYIHEMWNNSSSWEKTQALGKRIEQLAADPASTPEQKAAVAQAYLQHYADNTQEIDDEQASRPMTDSPLDPMSLAFVGDPNAGKNAARDPAHGNTGYALELARSWTKDSAIPFRGGKLGAKDHVAAGPGQVLK